MNRNLLLGLLIGVAAVAAVLAKPRRRTRAGLREAWPLQPSPTLLTDPEQVLYRRLVQALPGHIVLAQVQLMQALRFKRGAWSPSVFNRICQLSVDFLVLKPDTSIVAAVELDDSSHDRPDRRDADARKEHALWSAGVPLLRWHVGKMPDTAVIGAAVADVISVGQITAER
jgi:very-short-patch-repair endonuclease